MRKTRYVAITDDGRDKGKTYQITEMAASQADDWGTRAALALVRANPDLTDVIGTGMAAVAVAGFKALLQLPFEEAKELMDELFACVKICRLKEQPETGFALQEEDVEEVLTRLKLKMEAFELHTGFSFAGLKSTLTSAPAQTLPTEPFPTSTSQLSPAQ